MVKNKPTELDEGGSNADPVVATPSPVEIQPVSEENTSENMDIEPPVETVAHSSHPSTTNKPSDAVSASSP